MCVCVVDLCQRGGRGKYLGGGGRGGYNRCVCGRSMLEGRERKVFGGGGRGGYNRCPQLFFFWYQLINLETVDGSR